MRLGSMLKALNILIDIGFNTPWGINSIKKWTFEVGNQTQFTGNGNYDNRLQFWAFHKLNLMKKRRHFEAPPRMTN